MIKKNILYLLVLSLYLHLSLSSFAMDDEKKTKSYIAKAMDANEDKIKKYTDKIHKYNNKIKELEILLQELGVSPNKTEVKHDQDVSRLVEIEKYIKKYREDHNLSQEEMGRALGFNELVEPYRFLDAYL